MFDQADEPTLGSLDDLRRIDLTDGAWVDVLPGWLTGSDALLDHLLQHVPWRAEQRRMYDQVLATPRMLCWYSGENGFPHPVLDRARAMLNTRYADELGEPFVTAGLCLYRDGRDSVAWHGDRIGRGAREDAMVAILSVGSERPLLLRPQHAADGARTSMRIPSGHGDLLVMGGSCQRTWEHAIPKTTHGVGPRISIQFRPAGVA
jgi:alkylated DNA repair dioxygenase AlkB